MSRKTYWMILLNPIFLVLYGVGLRVVYQFCKNGNVSKRLPIILAIFAIGLLWLIVWTILESDDRGASWQYVSYVAFPF